MKKLRIDFLFAVALMLGGGLAVANEVKTVDPNVYNSTPGSGDNWVPLTNPDNISCDADDTVNCKAFDDGNGNITVTDKGRAN